MLWELLPESGTVQAVVQWLVFVVVVMLALGAGFFALALGAMGLDRVKREGKKLLGRPDVLAVAEGLAAVDVAGLHRYVDDPNDMLILFFAQALRVLVPSLDPAGMVRQVDRVFTVFGQLQMIWPQIKEALGLVAPPKEPDGQ